MGRKQIIALAARRPGMLPDDLDWGRALRDAQEFGIGYLDQLVAHRERADTNDALYRGALFRLMHVLVDLGQYERALPYARKIDSLLQADGIEQVARELSHDRFDDYVAAVPAYLGLHYFYRGILQLNHLADPAGAARSFATSAHLCKLEDGLGFFPRTGWFERAKLHEGLALQSASRPSEALAAFEALMPTRARLPVEHLEQLNHHKILAHLALRDFEGIRQFVNLLLGPTGAAGGPAADA